MNDFTPSIMQDDVCCFISGVTSVELHRHHIFYGRANRKLSEQYGLWVWLTPMLHNLGGKNCVHENKKLDGGLKVLGQQKFMAHYGKTADEFRAIFGRNYL